MMRMMLGPLAVLVVAALGAHWATLGLAPSVIMDRALVTLKDRGIAEHAFTAPRRVTPETQVVVRSSPDMFYSLCRYDLSAPGSALKVTMGAWPDYQSLSFIDANTNTFATIRGKGRKVSAHLAAQGQASGSAPVSKPGESDLISPTQRGVILIRRLAPTQELFDKAAETAEADACEILYS